MEINTLSIIRKSKWGNLLYFDVFEFPNELMAVRLLLHLISPSGSFSMIGSF